MPKSILGLIPALALALVLVAPQSSRAGGWYYGGWHGWGGYPHTSFVFGFGAPYYYGGPVYYGAPYYYGYPAPATYIYTPPAVVAPSQPQVYSDPAPSRSSYWYYCQNPQGYYPYVQNCPAGWTQVVPQSPSQ